jgi:hypothetical protein
MIGTNIFKTEITPVKGVILLAHGLNTNPIKMGDDRTEGTLVKLFIDAGYHVYRVILPGHIGSINEMQNISSQNWLNSAHIQYNEAAAIAQKYDIPIYLAAFSLGALIYKYLLSNEESVTFSGSILFAPALAIKNHIRFFIRFAGIFLFESSIITSRAPLEYRAQRGVSVSAYRAMLELENAMYENRFRNSNIPTIIFIDPSDELICICILRGHIENFYLSNWVIVPISNNGSVITPQYNHLIIDNKSVSEETWNYISKNIYLFLENIK